MNIFELLFNCIYDPIAFIFMLICVFAMVFINVNAQRKIDKAIEREQSERKEIKKILSDMPSLESL